MALPAATKYADFDLGTGANDGSSKANAWQTMQAAADGATAGAIVYCKGTDTLAAKVDMDTNSGTDAGGPIIFLGCDASWNPGDGLAIVDGDSAALHCLDFGAVNNVEFWYFNFKGATASNVDAVADTATGALRYCTIENAGGSGFASVDSIVKFDFWQLDRCIIRNNTDYGVYGWTEVAIADCAIYGNGNAGILAKIQSMCIHGCAIYENTTQNVDIALDSVSITNCVIDSVTGDNITIVASQHNAYIRWNVISNASAYGIDQADAGALNNSEDYNLFYNNTSGNTNNIADGNNSVTGTSDPYIDAANDNYTRSRHGSLIETQVDIGPFNIYPSAGLPAKLAYKTVYGFGNMGTAQ